MREQVVMIRVLTLCGVLAIAAPAGAQATADATTVGSAGAASAGSAPAMPQPAQQKFQMQMFEMTLQAAVKHGAEIFAQEVPPMPGVQLTSEEPQVRGFAPPTEDGGLLFVVV